MHPIKHHARHREHTHLFPCVIPFSALSLRLFGSDITPVGQKLQEQKRMKEQKASELQNPSGTSAESVVDSGAVEQNDEAMDDVNEEK